MRRSILTSVVIASGIAFFAGHAQGQDDESTRIARAVVTRSLQAMGGEEAWDETRYLVWDIFGETHYWDKSTGDFRWEADSLTAILNVNTG